MTTRNGETSEPVLQDRHDAHTGVEPDAIAKALLENLHYLQAKLPQHATRNDWYMALAYTVRERMLDRYIRTVEGISGATPDAKIVAYLSAEFLTGPQLGNSLISLGIWQQTEAALAKLGQDLNSLMDQEEEPGLGNGGLGRLAACYMDSLATLQVPAIGYGIRYEFGIFDQAIRDGWQVEMTDKWLRFGNPWEIGRSEISFDVMFGGHTEAYDDHGRYRVRWVPEKVVKGIAYDTPVPGYRVSTSNLLRLWKAEAAESFEFDAFNVGDYYGAVDQKVESETITKVLYPNDEPEAGKQLRLQQQYFFVSCSLQDMIRMHLLRGRALTEFHECWAAQLNDTHPSIAIAELMRLLVDEHSMDWDQAWAITQHTCAYTNHTLLAEALETVAAPALRQGAAAPPGDHLRDQSTVSRRPAAAVSGGRTADRAVCRSSTKRASKYVRMAHLASVGSHAINGVAALHTELLKQTVLRDFYTVAPERFFNVTNGVTPRRWMALSNPKLSALITRHIGDRWVSNLEHEIERIEPLAGDADFQREWREVKAGNKRILAALIKEHTGVAVDPGSLFDVQVKRLHEYKRQHLNVLYLDHVVHAPEARRGCRGDAAHRDLRRQGRSGVSHGQADHQADQRGRVRRQPRPAGLRPAHRGVLPGLQRQARPAGVSGRRSLGADLDRGQGGLWHRQHEVCDERSVDDRHTGWRERRDPGRGGPRELLPVRSDGRGGCRTESGGL